MEISFVSLQRCDVRLGCFLIHTVFRVLHIVDNLQIIIFFKMNIINIGSFFNDLVYHQLWMNCDPSSTW